MSLITIPILIALGSLVIGLFAIIKKRTLFHDLEVDPIDKNIASELANAGEDSKNLRILISQINSVKQYLEGEIMVLKESFYFEKKLLSQYILDNENLINRHFDDLNTLINSKVGDDLNSKLDSIINNKESISKLDSKLKK